MKRNMFVVVSVLSMVVFIVACSTQTNESINQQQNDFIFDEIYDFIEEIAGREIFVCDYKTPDEQTSAMPQQGDLLYENFLDFASEGVDNPHPLAEAFGQYVANHYVGVAQFVKLDATGTPGVLFRVFDLGGFQLLYYYNGEVVSHELGDLGDLQLLGLGKYGIWYGGGSSSWYFDYLIWLEYGSLVSYSWSFFGRNATGLEYDEFTFNGQRVPEDEYRLLVRRTLERHGIISGAAFYGWDDQRTQILALTADAPIDIPVVRIRSSPVQDVGITVAINGMTVYFANQRILQFDGTEGYLSTQPAMIDGHIFVSIRAIYEALGFSLTQHSASRITLSRDNDTVEIILDRTTFTVNGTIHTLDMPARVINGTSMFPVRAVLEAVGYDVSWDGNSRTVIISTGN